MRSKLTWSIFWTLAAVFVIAVLFMAVPALNKTARMDIVMLTVGILLVILGGLLIFLTVREDVRGLMRAFLILTGAAAAGITVSVLLHNTVYGLFIHFFGEDFWAGINMPDEPVFFILGLVVCPLAYLTGSIGSIVLARRVRQ